MGRPDSRESYSIKATPFGVEVTGRSSAGLYYAAQTLRQLVEGTGDAASLPEVEIHDSKQLCVMSKRALHQFAQSRFNACFFGDFPLEVNQSRTRSTRTE
jgi:hypothetical protein